MNDVLRAQPALIVIAAGLQYPGNLGTIARSAEAFGATGTLQAMGPSASELESPSCFGRINVPCPRGEG
jgi:tRNA G18 (ribose-2'-O)-methylase SpoU